MSKPLLQAIYSRLAGDSTLTALLESYGGNPAIFSGPVIPQDFEFTEGGTKAALMIHPPINDVMDGPKDNAHRDVQIDIQGFSEQPTSVGPLHDVMERVYILMNRSPLTITGFTNPTIVAGGPVGAPGDRINNLTVTVNLKLVTS